jgi:hypothetical protein
MMAVCLAGRSSAGREDAVKKDKEMPAMRRIHSVACLLLALLGVLVCSVPVRASQERARDTTPGGVTANGFVVGACTHFSQGKGLLDRNLDRITQAGIASIRDEVPWGAVEREKGQLVMPEQFDTYVRRAADRGVSVLLILDYANRFYDDGDRPRSPEAIEGFCRYAEFVVRHFGKQVRLYEVWNEWDISIGLPQKYRKGGSAEDYVKLLKAVYPRIKAADPGVTVMAGACTSGGVKKGWLEETVKLGALDFCDAISIHSYNYSDKFPQRGPEACSAWMTGVQEMLRKYKAGGDRPEVAPLVSVASDVGPSGRRPTQRGAGILSASSGQALPAIQGRDALDTKTQGQDALATDRATGARSLPGDVPFYVTEMGWPTHVGKNGTDPELSGSYLARLYLLARTSPSFQGLWWYDFQDDGWKAEYNEDNFGLVRPDLTPKPAYEVLADIAPVVANGQYVDRLPAKDESLWVLRFRVGREDRWALWSADDQERQVILETESPARPLTIQQAGHEPDVARWGFRDWTNRRSEVVPNRLSLVVGPRPYLIGDDLSGVSIVEAIVRSRQAAVTPGEVP